MKCLNCPDTTLVPNDMQGIEVDRCPTCRGVWLDCGELDRIIDRSDRGSAQAMRRNSSSRAEISDAHYSLHARPTIPCRRKSILRELLISDPASHQPALALHGTRRRLRHLFGILASMIVLHFSRQREFNADAGAATLLSSPLPMIDAMRRLDGPVFQPPADSATYQTA